MATMNVSLPDPMREWIEAQIKTGRYANASDYMRDLIRRDQEAKDALIDALELGAKSGVSKRTLDDTWKSAKGKTLGRAKKNCHLPLVTSRFPTSECSRLNSAQIFQLILSKTARITYLLRESLSVLGLSSLFL